MWTVLASLPTVKWAADAVATPVQHMGFTPEELEQLASFWLRIDLITGRPPVSAADFAVNVLAPFLLPICSWPVRRRVRRDTRSAPRAEVTRHGLT